MASSHIRRVFTLALLVLAVCGTTAFAQLPSARLLSVYPPGGARGSTVEVEVHGDDLEPADGLLFSHSGIRATHVIDETNPFLRDRAIPNRFRVEIAPDVPTGRYDVRVAGRFGVSNPRTFVVSNVAESVESEPNDAREQATALAVGSIANGRSNARADLDWWRIEGRPSERVFIRCESRDLDSRMEAILTYFDAEGREIARARETAARPAELDVVLSNEGHGYVRVNDAVYDGSGHHVYRLVVTAGPVIDAVLPPAIVAGREARVTILGRGLEGGTPAESLRLGEHPLEKLEVTIAAPASAPGGEPPGPRGFDRPEQLRLRAFPWWLEASEGAFSEPIWIGLAEAPVVVETEPNDEGDQATAVQIPFEAAGTLYPLRDVDAFSFEAAAGEHLRIDVLAQRIGSPIDPYVIVERVTDEAAQVVRRVDDLEPIVGDRHFRARTDDARFDLRIEQAGVYRILLRDLNGELRADPRSVYRLVVRRVEPAGAWVAQPVEPGVEEDPNRNAPALAGLLLRRGGTAALAVHAARGGVDRDVAFRVEGLPQGVTASPLLLRPGQALGRIVLAAADDAETITTSIRVVGEVRTDGEPVPVVARPGALSWPAIPNRMAERSRLAGGLALSVRAEEVAPVTLRVPGPIEMSRAGTVRLPLEATRREGVNAKLAVELQGLPAGVAAKPAAFEPDQTRAEVEITIAENAPVGTFHLDWIVRGQTSISSAPEIVDAITAKKSAIEGELARIESELETSSATLAGAEKLVTDTEAKVRELDAEVEAAIEQVMGFAGAKDATVTSEALRAALANLVERSEARALARVELESARKERDALAAERTERERSRELARQAIAVIAGDLERAKERAKARNVRFAFFGPPAELRIAPAPIEIASAPEAIVVRPGESAALTLVVTRKFGFAGPVKARLEIPQGGPPLGCEAVESPGDAESVTLTIDASRCEPTPAAIDATIRLSVRFGDKDLEIARPVRVTLEPEVAGAATATATAIDADGGPDGKQGGEE